jgi:ParB family chromosome partitioning protein
MEVFQKMTNEVLELLIDSVIPDKNQPRKTFDETNLNELAASIKEHGLLQPILVRPVGNCKYQLVHGERRFRACKLLGFKTIKEVRNLTDNQVLEIQLVENLQREDLNPIEEAETFSRMVKELGYTHEQIAQRISKSREYVTNKLRLLKLPDDIKKAMQDGKIKEGHARALIPLEESKQTEVLNEIVDKGLNVRETEELAHNVNGNVSRETSSDEDKTLLVPIPCKVYTLLKDVARKMKTKPEDLIVKAVLAFAERDVKT